MSKDACRRFSDEGYRHYSVVDLGFKYNMTDLQAAIGQHSRRGERTSSSVSLFAAYPLRWASTQLAAGEVTDRPELVFNRRFSHYSLS
jgi:hypothetical protein